MQMARPLAMLSSVTRILQVSISQEAPQFSKRYGKPSVKTFSDINRIRESLEKQVERILSWSIAAQMPGKFPRQFQEVRSNSRVRNVLLLRGVTFRPIYGTMLKNILW